MENIIILFLHGRGIGHQETLKKDSPSLSRVTSGNSGFPRLVPVTSGSFSRSLWEFRDTVVLGGASRDTTEFGSMEEGLFSSWGRNLRVPLHFWLWLQGLCRVETGVRPRLVLRNGTPLASLVVLRVTGHLSRCVWNLWLFPDDATGVSVPLRVVTSSSWLHWKKCLGIGTYLGSTGISVSFGMCINHEASSWVSIWEQPPSDVRLEGRDPFGDKAGK